MELLLATHNPGKRQEWLALLEGLDVTLYLPDDLGLHTEVEETGETYRENALLKARTLAAASGMPTLADDSGLEVDALDGAPGVRSARYKLGTDEVRYRALLEALEGVPEQDRGARFRCVAALVLPQKSDEAPREFNTEGICEGHIGFTPRGEQGFGYDPVFYVQARDLTMAELAPEEKNRISHRAHAAQEMRRVLAQVLR